MVFADRVRTDGRCIIAPGLEIRPKEWSSNIPFGLAVAAQKRNEQQEYRADPGRRSPSHRLSTGLRCVAGGNVRRFASDCKLVERWTVSRAAGTASRRSRRAQGARPHLTTISTIGHFDATRGCRVTSGQVSVSELLGTKVSQLGIFPDFKPVMNQRRAVPKSRG